MRQILKCCLLALSIIGHPSASLGQAWCPKPTGILSREYAHSSTASVRQFAEKISKGKDYLIISSVSPAGLKKNISPDTKQQAIDAYAASPNFSQIKNEEIWRAVLTSTEQRLVKGGLPKYKAKIEAERQFLEFMFEQDMSSSIEYLYIYSSRPSALIDLAGTAASERGAVIEGKREEIAKIFTINVADENPLERLANQMDLGAVVLEGIDHPSNLHQTFPAGIPIVKIRDKTLAFSKINSAQLATWKDWNFFPKRAATDTSIISLLPTQPAPVRAWGFDAIKAAKYADAGAAFSKQINNAGYRQSFVTAATKQEFISRIKRDSSKKSVIYIVGEATESGAIRVPGSTELITQDDLRGIDLSNSYFISCNSDKIGTNTAAMTFVGKIYSDRAAKVLEVMLPSIEQSRPENSIVVRLKSEASNGILVDALAEIACALASDRSCPFGLYALLSDQ
jgi:hypothetical protein